MGRPWPYVAPCLNTTWRRITESHHTFDGLIILKNLSFACDAAAMDFSRKFTNHGDLLNTIDQWVHNRNQNSHRLLLVVTTHTPLWLEELARLGDFDYISHASEADRSDRIAALLGSERNGAVVALAQKPDLGLIAATAGTIKARGLLVLGVDETHASKSSRRLLKLAGQLAKEHPYCVAHAVTTAETTPYKETNVATPQPLPHRKGSASTSKLAQNVDLLNPRALAEQNNLLSTAIEYICSRQQSCIAIAGARGRGKSTLLARLAKHFDSDGKTVAVTTQNKLALGSWAQHAPLSGQWFIAPEKAAKQTGWLLFVDEAANFPLASIQRFLGNFSHVVLAATVDGYESGGRALDIRFLSEQSQSNNDFLQLEPQEPWRWPANDPLETFVAKLLLNQKTEQAKAYTKDVNAIECHIRRIPQEELANDEALLASVFSLLKATHYQTSTKDLEHLLDASSLQVWAQLQRVEGYEQAVAVLLLEIEGEIENNSNLHEAIVSKERRLPNQLLPQLLAQSANTAAALHKRYGRVLRIAVAPEHRRCRLATQLLEAVSAETQLDALGASFASDEGSNAFWQSNNFMTFHKGYRENPRTGKHAVAVLRSFEPISQAALLTAAQIYEDNENSHEGSDEGSSQAALTMDEKALLRRFALGQRSMHDTRGAIRRLCLVRTLPLERTGSQSRKVHELLLRNCVEEAIRDH